jgi:hypothetical protein
MHFMRYGYTEYVRRVMALAEVNLEHLESEKHERWTPYLDTEDRLQRAAQDQP